MGFLTTRKEAPMIHRFREEVYQSFEQRSDTGLELIDALTSTPGVESPVELSESPLFRRRFSSVYDTLKRGRLQYDRLRQVLDELQPADAETIAGYEVYAMDCTDEPAPEAETLPDRSRTKVPGWHDALRPVFQVRRYTTLQTPAALFLDWPNHHCVGGPGANVSVALCHRA